MRKFGQRLFGSGFVVRPVAAWLAAVTVVTLILVVGSSQVPAKNHASTMALVGEATDLVLRIRGLPYLQTANRYGNRMGVMSEAQLLIRTRLLTGENGISRLLIIDARLVSSDGENIWSSTMVSENTALEFVQAEIGRTLTEAMQHVGVDDGRISI